MGVHTPGKITHVDDFDPEMVGAGSYSKVVVLPMLWYIY